MKILSHRGNLNGPDAFAENSKEAILQAISSGFEVEVDVWVRKDRFYLGHDNATEHVETGFLLEYSDYLWLHAKSLEAMTKMKSTGGLHYFFHQQDDYTITSRNYIWAYPGKPGNKYTICVDKDAKMKGYKPSEVMGVCTDYPLYLKQILDGG